MAIVGQFVSIVLCVCCLGHISVAISRPSSIVLENNEFNNILVAIDDSVADTPSLVQNIKDTFTKASTFMYEATQHRAFFHDVTILVPATWANNGYGQATSHILNNADVIFTNPISSAAPPDAVHDDPVVSLPAESRDGVHAAPPVDEGPRLSHPPAMTKTYAGCGHQGVRVTLTTDILTDRSLAATLGPPEKILVHEWAHFRWGVFDEYALDGEPQFYFSPKTGELEGVRCTEIIQGIIRRKDPATGGTVYCRDLDPMTGLFPEGCKFLPYPGGPYVANIQASIMDRVNIRPMAKFCDDEDSNVTRHNYDAPSRHNRLCGHRSTWSVIMTSQDFANNANPSRDGADTAPVFNVVQAQASRRMLLALDTSASMADDHKLTRVRQAVATFVQEGVASSTEIGLTTFSDGLHVQRAPSTLNSTGDRQSFADDLPDSQSGATDITLALTSAAQLLQDGKSPETTQPHTDSAPVTSNVSLPPSAGDHVMRSTSRGSHVVMVTDGQETTGASVTSALPVLRKAGVMVSFVVLGNRPQPQLEQLAQQTGGRIYYDSNSDSSTASMDAFFDVFQTSSASPASSPIQILSRAQALDQGHSLQGVVYIDEAVGNKTTFLISYDVTLPDVRVTSPSGRVYSAIYPEFRLDGRLNMVIIVIPYTAEYGRWSYRITNPVYQRVSLLVLSRPSSSSVSPVRLTGMVTPHKHTLSSTMATPSTMHLFAEATKGHNPVTGLRVNALVNKPDGSSETVELMDNGAGADIVEGDGVYSRFYSRLQHPGLYTVQLTATGHSKDCTDCSNRYVQRSVSAGHIIISPKKTHNDTTPMPAGHRQSDMEAPVRISDLRVVKTSGSNSTVVLSWRASGDDFDHDTASYYEVYIAPSAKDLMAGTSLVTNVTQSDVIHGNLVAPKPFGVREYYMVRIPNALPFKNRGQFVFSVVAVDEAGNKGEHSNYVTVGLGKVPDVTDKKYWQDGQFQAATTQLDAPQDQKLLIAALLGSVSTVLVLVIVLSVIVSFFTRQNKEKKLGLPQKNESFLECEKGQKHVFSMA